MTSGNDYSFDLFFAEHHAVASSFRIDTSIKLKPREVPEPSTLFLLGMGLIGLGVARRKIKLFFTQQAEIKRANHKE